MCGIVPSPDVAIIACPGRDTRRTDKLEPLGEAVAVLEFARAETQKRAPHLTHPLLCLDAIKAGVEQGGQAGLKQVRAHALGRSWGSCAYSCDWLQIDAGT